MDEEEEYEYTSEKVYTLSTSDNTTTVPITGTITGTTFIINDSRIYATDNSWDITDSTNTFIFNVSKVLCYQCLHEHDSNTIHHCNKPDYLQGLVVAPSVETYKNLHSLNGKGWVCRIESAIESPVTLGVSGSSSWTISYSQGLFKLGDIVTITA
mgnify:CR=1 FL=1